MEMNVDIPPYQDPNYKTLCETNPGPGCPTGTTVQNPASVQYNTAIDPNNPLKSIPKQQSSAVGVSVKIKKDNTVELNKGNK